MATETTKTNALRKKLKSRIYCEKMSNPYRRGTPDCYYSGSTGGLWSEHKYLRSIPKTVDVTRITTPLQQQWLEGRHREGRSVSMLIFTPDGGVLLHGLSWQLTYSREEFKAMEVSMNQLAELIVAFCGEIPGGPFEQVNIRV